MNDSNDYDNDSDDDKILDNKNSVFKINTVVKCLILSRSHIHYFTQRTQRSKGKF